MANPIPIFYTITDLVYGGGQTVIAKLLPHIDRQQFTPSIVTLSGGDSLLADELRQQGVSVHDLHMKKSWPIPALYRYFQLIKREKPQLIHTSLFHANLATRLVGRLAGVPIIVSWRQNIELGSDLRERINRATVWIDDKVVAVCGPAKTAEVERSGVSPDKVIVIPNSVDVTDLQQKMAGGRASIRAEFDLAETDTILITIGRLHPQKGLHHLLNTLPDILDKQPQLKLLLVGEGELENDLKAQTAALNLQNHVIFTGRRPDVPALLDAADLFVLPSLWEGLPLVVLEAMAAGLPIVATDVGGTAEAIHHQKTGLLIPPADEPALKSNILTLLDNPAQRQQLAQNALTVVSSDFAAPHIAQQLTNLYHTLLTKR